MEHLDVAVIGGGQSGLAAAHALRKQGLEPVVLEASGQAAGSWPHFYDSLTLFSPARYSPLPGLPFGGDPERYPHRDEVVAYLLRYADRLDADIRTGQRVSEVQTDGDGFTLALEDGSRLAARGVVAATAALAGRTAPPCRAWTPSPGPSGVSRTTAPRALRRAAGRGRRRRQLGVQVAAELAAHARVSLANRAPVKWFTQRR
ncbi:MULTISPECIES: NAD(P)-binding domain-containing protein [unclassified Streptomyces]|uniref:NAD(P)-binding domain-containing protein n=1 Tax=unclassified Streptomyces TaxID=2593676 RepID=UPI002DD9D3BC|nr:NAD(P)-binding domain-containing protein [Streptomyces sp. NBC_01750]WSB04389.1 NAD(P)-binding domain-containing protein [Streptomyces sp. NBC_01794]WSD31329.1 NAD(P)-binding domain-containing protein [Streptomyces sp. NBC_01750]